MNQNAQTTPQHLESNVPRWVRYTFGGLAALFLLPMVAMIVAIASVALAPVAAIGLPFVWQGLIGFPKPRLTLELPGLRPTERKISSQARVSVA